MADTYDYATISGQRGLATMSARPDSPAALAGHPSPDRGSGPWVLRLVCCGYDDGIERYATWDEADTFRQAYAGPGGHDRTAILTRDLDTTYHRRRVARRRVVAAEYARLAAEAPERT